MAESLQTLFARGLISPLNNFCITQYQFHYNQIQKLSSLDQVKIWLGYLHLRALAWLSLECLACTQMPHLLALMETLKKL